MTNRRVHAKQGRAVLGDLDHEYASRYVAIPERLGLKSHLQCTQILTDTEEAEAQANALQSAPRGLLRIAVPVTFGLQHVAPAVRADMTGYPEVNFDIAVAERFVNLIEEGFDLTIRVGPLAIPT